MGDSSDQVDAGLIERAEQAVSRRLSGHRLEHSFGVARTARHLAEVYGGCEASHAYLAGLLHDWDKKVPKDRIVARARELGVELSDEMVATPSVLHGVTAAAALPREFGPVPDDVLRAIARHTVPVADMTPLDEIVYVSDKIEPGRPAEHTKAVRDLVGDKSLHEVYLVTFASSIVWLFETRRPVFLEAVRVWNQVCEGR
ncbi:MAG: bis(5'-nucleosyl)-tetraphosphatase (symmetrical) YqeK [Coriobacteriales bacterium]